MIYTFTKYSNVFACSVHSLDQRYRQLDHQIAAQNQNGNKSRSLQKKLRLKLVYHQGDGLGSHRAKKGHRRNSHHGIDKKIRCHFQNRQLCLR